MERYHRVVKPARIRQAIPISSNDILITARGKMRNYIAFATRLFEEKGASEVVLKAVERAVNKAVPIAEILKRRIAGLHQVTSIESTYLTDVWQPLEEGLVPVEISRRISVITITLSTKELDTSSPGYQPPVPADQVKPRAQIELENENIDDSPRDGGGMKAHHGTSFTLRLKVGMGVVMADDSKTSVAAKLALVVVKAVVNVANAGLVITATALAKETWAHRQAEVACACGQFEVTSAAQRKP
ncbi:hypothetical protein R1sor_001760 [Riccia sorocarpa]|uniref:DNA/RNA-binding protein Alba-like domain-containing protein n=1 Tax=Riccia sorocarpa TaxID=122646 RepID=A0ABD3GXQ3_9MARC